MVSEQIQNYVNLVAGAGRATKEKAVEAAQGLISATKLDTVAADASERVNKLAEDILAASRSNRAHLASFVHTEVDKTAARLGFARVVDLDLLREEVAALRVAIGAAAADIPTAAEAAAAAAEAEAGGEADSAAAADDAADSDAAADDVESEVAEAGADSEDGNSDGADADPAEEKSADK